MVQVEGGRKSYDTTGLGASRQQLATEAPVMGPFPGPKTCCRWNASETSVRSALQKAQQQLVTEASLSFPVSQIDKLHSCYT